MDLLSILNLKKQGSGEELLQKKTVNLNYLDKNQNEFFNIMAGRKEGIGSGDPLSKQLKSGFGSWDVDNTHIDGKSLLVVEKRNLELDPLSSTHASIESNKKGKHPKAEPLDSILLEIPSTQPRLLNSKDAESEFKNNNDGNTGSKSVSGKARLMHGEASGLKLNSSGDLSYLKDGANDFNDKGLKTPLNQQRNNTSRALKKENGGDVIRQSDTDDMGWNRHWVDSKEKVDVPFNSRFAINPDIQKFISSIATTKDGSKSEDEFVNLDTGSGESVFSLGAAKDRTLVKSINISQFKSLLIDEIQTAREIGELKKEMTVNIRPSILGDVAITIANGSDGCVISLITTSQAATNYLSLLKRELEKTSGSKINIGSTVVDSKGNVSVVNFKEQHSLKKQE